MIEVDLYYFDVSNPGQLIPSSCIDDFQKFTNDTSFEANVTRILGENDYFVDVCAPYFNMDELKLSDVVGVPDSQNQVRFVYMFCLKMCS